MAKKIPAGAPTWMVTFADLMALLLTMFVLLLSFSTMDAQRYQVIANAMGDAFGLSAMMNLGGMLEVGVTHQIESPLGPDVPVAQIDIPEKAPPVEPENRRPRRPKSRPPRSSRRLRKAAPTTRRWSRRSRTRWAVASCGSRKKRAPP